MGTPSGPASASDLAHDDGDGGRVFDIAVVTPGSATSCLKKGVVAVQRDRVLSRWRDRYFMLMPDYLACFKKASSTPGVRGGGFPSASGMGSFQFKVSYLNYSRMISLNFTLGCARYGAQDTSQTTVRPPLT
jgi:hypothetical protein